MGLNFCRQFVPSCSLYDDTSTNVGKDTLASCHCFSSHHIIYLTKPRCYSFFSEYHLLNLYPGSKLNKTAPAWPPLLLLAGLVKWLVFG